MKKILPIMMLFASVFTWAQDATLSAEQMLKGKHKAHIDRSLAYFQFDKVANGKIVGYYTDHGKRKKIKGSYKAKPISFGYEYQIMLAEDGTSKNDGVFKLNLDITSKYENIEGRWSSYDSKLKKKISK